MKEFFKLKNIWMVKNKVEKETEQWAVSAHSTSPGVSWLDFHV